MDKALVKFLRDVAICFVQIVFAICMASILAAWFDWSYDRALALVALCVAVLNGLR